MAKAFGVTLFVFAALAGALGAAALALISGLASANSRQGNTSAVMLGVLVLWLLTLGGSVALLVHGWRLTASAAAALPLFVLIGMFVYTSFVVETRRARTGRVEVDSNGMIHEIFDVPDPSTRPASNPTEGRS